MTIPIPAGWKPISSAPKDGTEILAWREDCGQFIAKYTSADAFPMTQDELDAMDEETLFAKDWFTQWPDATRLDGSEAPTLWQPLPVDPCATCNGQGAVGNIRNAEPCPDCTPASVAPGDAQDERQAFEAWMASRNLGLLRDGDSYSLTYARRAWEAWQARASVAAPAAGDAQPKFDIEAAAQKLAECMDYPWAHMPEQGRTHMRKYAQAVIDAALAAQVPHNGGAA